MSRTIDQRIHTEIFQRCWHETEDDADGVPVCVKCQLFVYPFDDDNPKYSSDIGHAFAVVEKMGSDGWDWEMAKTSDGYCIEFCKMSAKYLITGKRS